MLNVLYAGAPNLLLSVSYYLLLFYFGCCPRFSLLLSVHYFMYIFYLHFDSKFKVDKLAWQAAFKFPCARVNEQGAPMYLVLEFCRNPLKISLGEMGAT
jgi:hypothetical protein